MPTIDVLLATYNGARYLPEQLRSLKAQTFADWRLVVRVNGQRVFEKLINDELTRPQRGWASLQVDLSAFRGQKVLLEVLNEANDGNNDHAIWKRVVLRDMTTP